MGAFPIGQLDAQTSPPTQQNENEPIRAVLAKLEQVTESALLAWQRERYDVVLWIEKVDPNTLAAVQKIVKQCGSADYFFEVARCPELAKKASRMDGQHSRASRMDEVV